MVICWDISGGHFNPAVTVSQLIASKQIKDNMVPALLMIAAQFIGAVASYFLAWSVLCSYSWMDDQHDDPKHSISVYWVSIIAPKSVSAVSAANGTGWDLGTTDDFGPMTFDDDYSVGYTRNWQTIFATLLLTIVFCFAFGVLMNKETRPTKNPIVTILLVERMLSGYM